MLHLKRAAAAGSLERLASSIALVEIKKFSM